MRTRLTPQAADEALAPVASLTAIPAPTPTRSVEGAADIAPEPQTVIAAPMLTRLEMAAAGQA